MARLNSLYHRIEELESDLGLVELPDGTLFKPSSSLDLMLMHAKLCRIWEGRPNYPIQSWRSGTFEELCQVDTGPGRMGIISILITDLARRLCA
jgi:hypothetical protein